MDALQKACELRAGGDSVDWFFLAMARWQLGDKEQAVAWYDRAVQWMEKNQPRNEELIRFRAEAAECSKIDHNDFCSGGQAMKSWKYAIVPILFVLGGMGWLLRVVKQLIREEPITAPRSFSQACSRSHRYCVAAARKTSGETARGEFP